MSAFAYGSVRPAYKKDNNSNTETAPAHSKALTTERAVNPFARTLVRDPWAPNLDNPLLCSQDARRIIEERRLKTADVPVRFVDPSLYTHTVKKEHPFYRTTSNDYGAHKPTQMEFPSAYYSTNNNFTKSFNCNVFTSQTLTTAPPKKPLGG